MTEVRFLTQVADPIGYACRLLRKALHQGSQVVVTGPAATLQRLDAQLWTFDALAFVPHVLLRAGQSVAPRLRRTPIWLALPGAAAPVHDVLVNVGGEPPPGFESFRRVVEIVGADADEVKAARRRWKHYEERGYALEHHAVGA